MLNEEQKNFIKGYTEQYFNGLGYDLKRNISCLNPDHEDRNPSMSFYKEGNLFKCFSCNFKVDIFKMVELQEKLTDFKDQVNFLIDKYDINLPRFNAKDSLNDNNDVTNGKIVLSFDDFKIYNNILKEKDFKNNGAEYLKKRGILNTELYNAIGVNGDKLVFPTAINEDSTGFTAYIERRIGKLSNMKERYKAHGKGGLYNAIALKNEGAIFITEGVFDALSIQELGYDAIAIGGAVKSDYLIETLEKYKNQINKTEYIIALDNDSAGVNGAVKLYKELKELGKKVIVAYKLYDEYKDANAFLIADRNKFADSLYRCILDFNKYVDQHKKEYIASNSVSGYLNTFIENTKNSTGYKPIPTGFAVLDALLNGGLYSGLYVIGAISSLGKTTFTLQLGEQIAEHNDKDILIFSLEMSKDELIAKSLSRKTYEIAKKHSENYKIGSHTLTTLDILQNKIQGDYQKDILWESMIQYGRYAEKIFIYEADDNITGEKIRELVENHIKNTGRTPVVIIDYLQIIPSENSKLNDKQVADRNVSIFKRISRDFTTPVFVISSLNRGSYTERVTMSSFKESGGIEYGCDVLFGLNLLGLKQYDDKTNKYKTVDSDTVDKLKSKYPRDIELTILKNRNGETNKSVNFKYLTNYNLFIENYETFKK